MDVAEIDPIALRLDRLERDCRIWKRMGIGSLVAIAILAGIAARPDAIPESVEAKRFLVRDNQGRLRAALEVDLRGYPGLWLFDDQGKVRSELSVSFNQNPRLDFTNQKGDGTASLSYSPSDLPYLNLTGTGGKAGVHLLILPYPKGNIPTLYLTGSDGKQFFDISARPDGPKSMSLDGKDGKPRFSIELDQIDRPSLKLLDGDQKVIFEAPPPKP